jgi:hypothetical protein
VGTAGEIFYDSTNQTLRVYPGNVPAGKILADRDWVGSVGVINYNNLSSKPTLFSGSYTDLSNKPVLFSGSYTDLSNKPEGFQFSVAADDSTQRLISTDEVIKFVGAGGITTSSDAQGNITFTQGSVDLSGYLLLNGLSPMAANLPMGTYKITGLGAPSADTDAATKSYVDSNIVSGAVVFKGTWNASTNTPTLVNGTGTTGWQYAVSVSGTQDLGAGSIAFSAGDFVIYNGTVWQRIPASTIAEAGTLTGSTINATVTASSLTSVGSLTSLTVAGITTLQQITEVMSPKTGATGVVVHDFSTAAVFYHTSPAANFTINITNVPTTVNRVTTVSLIITQGVTGYYPNVLQIGGVAQTINWIGNVTPTPSVSRNDVVSFTLIRTATPAWIVTGAITGY